MERKTKTDANGRFRLVEPGGKSGTFVLSASAGGSTAKVKLACKHKKPQTGGATPKVWTPLVRRRRLDAEVGR